MICKMPISSDRSQDLLFYLESMRLPENTPKNEDVSLQTEEMMEDEKSSSSANRLNDPSKYSALVPFLIYDENKETIISRTARGINEGQLNPYEIDWREVTLYDTNFVRDLLEAIDSNLIKDVAQAIDDEDKRHAREDGQYTNIASEYYGTGQRNPFSYSYIRDNWQNDSEYVSAGTIAEGILDKRNKADAFLKKIELRKKNPTPNKNNPAEKCPPFDADIEILLQQIAELKFQVNQLAREKATIEDTNHDLAVREEKHRNENEIARAEKQKFMAKIAELEKKLEEKDVEPEDIMIAEDRKIDVIKILHAMCKIGLFQKSNGGKITQNAVMKYFGKMLNDDFSEYSSNLSTSKSKTKESSYMLVFEYLREAAYDYFKKNLKGYLGYT